MEEKKPLQINARPKFSSILNKNGRDVTVDYARDHVEFCHKEAQLAISFSKSNQIFWSLVLKNYTIWI